ncbi:MAG: endonuclease III [Candidatus Omnitrophica bacterium]|nr:endonuclease III [Candidatus Omnitrophota bacterium]
MLNNQHIDRVITLLRKGVKDLPDPSVTMVGKQWGDPFLVLISCIMSLRTKDETTLPAASRLFKTARTPRGILNLTAKQIEKLIYPVGFYKTKAKTIRAICRKLLEEFNGQVPDDLDVLLTFKGVGRKTANLVVTEGFHKLGICVDTHVHRISNRLGYVATSTPNDTEMVLREKLPKKHWIAYNTLLVLWGQNVCRPISPFCSQCPICKYCARCQVEKSR